MAAVVAHGESDVASVRDHVVTAMQRRSRLPAVVMAWCVLVLAICVLLPGEPDRPAPTSRPPAASPGADKFMLGDYASPVVPPGQIAGPGAIDGPATISALLAAHVNTYAYLIYPHRSRNPDVTTTQWAQLEGFAKLAGSAGIDVYVYLVPPTEASERSYAPFHWNYIAWFAAIGEVAARQPAIRGIMIDDFGGNVRFRPTLGFHFTPGYVATMLSAARRPAPWLTFLPVLYHHDMFGASAMLPAFRPYLDGVVFPYFGYSDGRTVPGNTVDASQALTQGVEVGHLLKCNEGESCTQIRFPGLASPSGRPNAAGLTRRLTPQPNQPRTLTLSVQDDSGSPAAAIAVEVRVGDTLVKRVSPAQLGWSKVSVDLTAATSGQGAVDVTLTITRTGSPVGSVLVDDIHHSGFGENADWDADQFHSADGVDVDPVRSLRYIYMTYAIPLSAEHGVGASPAYVATVLSAVEQLRARQMVDGSLVFNLPLPGSLNTGDPRNYTLVQSTYARWRQ